MIFVQTHASIVTSVVIVFCVFFCTLIIVIATSTVVRYNNTNSDPVVGDDDTSEKRGKKKWNWNPEDTQPCNIRRYTDAEWQHTRLVSFKQQQQQQQQEEVEVEEYEQRDRMRIGNERRNNYNMDFPLSLTGTTTTSKTKNYGIVPPLYHEPFIIQRSRNVNELFRYKTHRHRILQQFDKNNHNNHTKFRVTLSSSNALSEHRQTVLFSEYLNTSYTIGETLPDQRSNESWYLFGETYTKEWHDAILQYYVLPPCATCQNDNVALSFGIGNAGSGVQWHTHGPGFSEAVHGRKHWILHPPTTRRPTNIHNNSNSSNFHEIPIDGYHKDQSSRYWMEYVYPSIPRDIRNRYYYECTLDPGDLIYFPNHWWHATINLDRYTAFISTFTNEYMYQ